jgi:endonuclease/exonuclease/phosphatase family metal-dependent hydrolase
MPGVRLRLATLNAGDWFGPAGGPFGQGPKPDGEVDALAREITSIDADVVALQEVQSQRVLDGFAMSRLGPQAYPYRKVFVTNDPGQRNLAILSRYPIVETQSNRDRKLEGVPSSNPPFFTRDVAEALIDVQGIPFRVYNTHFRADPFFGKPFTEEKLKAAQDTRAAEGGGLQSIIAEDLPALAGRRYAVLADLNAAPTRPEIVTLTTAAEPRLFDPLAGREGPETWSHPATQERKDYILLSDAMAQNVLNAHVRNTPDAALASDHRAVVVDVMLYPSPEG